ncbi:ComEA family DNA-binding protein [Caminibacter sp.]
MKKLFFMLFVLAVGLFAKMNINTATADELCSLKGIGHAKAVAIIEYREKHPFKKPEDIMNVKGIGFKIFEKIKDEIEVKEEK